MTTVTLAPTVTDEQWRSFVAALRAHSHYQIALLGADHDIDPESLDALLGGHSVETAPYPLARMFDLDLYGPELSDIRDDARIKPIIKEAGSGAQAVSKEIDGLMQQAAKTAEEKLKNKKNPNDPQWKKDLNDARERTKKKSNELIDKTFDKLVKAGDDHPDLRPFLTKIGQWISGKLMDMVKMIVDWITGVVTAIVDWFKEAWRKVVAFFEKVGEWIKSIFS